MTPITRLTDSDIYRLCQVDPVGTALFNELYGDYVSSEVFDADPYKQAYKAGQRSVVLRLAAAIARAAQGDSPTA